MEQKLLDILCCPATKRPVTPLSRGEVDRLNRLIREGGLIHRDDSPVDQPLREALITDDRAWIYRVDDGIPVMLEGLALPGSALDDSRQG